ncbi:MAG: hypothetical protein JSW07_05710, partial [bacterium]
MKSLITLLLIVIHFICVMFLSGCVTDAPFKFEGTTVPQQMNDGWQVASPKDVNINQATIDEVYKNFVSEDRFLNA